jgi:CRISPR-associated endonuclease/helicase Cas3
VTAALGTDDFPRFFEALWSTDSRLEPFPWQRRLMRLVADERRGWPQVLDLPTGSGKTAVLDIALFHLAIEASRGTVARNAPRRIVMVVDRRTVVDQAYERAHLIADKLKQATKGILFDVAVTLRRLVEDRRGTSDPLMCAVLRGGMYRDPSWARTPDQPLIVASTVDQVGSRLLFRGYGVSDSMRPIHAGLLANDALIILDEVHLSRPFDETLSALERYRGWGEAPITAPWRVVRMSATPHVVDHEDRTVFSLDSADRKSPVLSKRLHAHKPARVRPIQVKGDEEERRNRFASECGREAGALLQEGARTVAVVLNCVDTARRVYEWLTTRSEDDRPRTEADVYLLTGRMRPFDRDEVVEDIRDRIRAGRQRALDDRPLVIVATQSIEAGADFDFDALVTECASIDALRQRFGRLDRMGEYGKARAVILGRKDEIEGQEDASVYGAALSATWEWLARKDEWDFGIDHLELPKKIEPFLSGAGSDGRDHAPVLLPAHLDAWAQTSPAPAADPDVSLWLHGLTGRPADVHVVWRADLTEEDVHPSREQYLRNLLSACPPAPAEALTVPFRAVRDWLNKVAEGDIADVEREPLAVEPETRTPFPRYAIRWRGDDTEVIRGSGTRREKTLRPGDTIVVPAIYGGLGRVHRNWDPGSTRSREDVGLDLGDVVQLPQKGRAVLRLHPAVLKSLGLSEAPILPEDASPGEERDEIQEWLETLQPHLPDTPLLTSAVTATLDALRRGRWRLEGIDDGRGDRRRVLVGRRLLKTGDDVTTEPDVSSFTGVPVPVALETHSRGVGRWVSDFGRHCGVGDSLGADLALAALFHDVGKADPRFQALLWGGDEVAALTGGQLIAKSSVNHRDRISRERARVLSRYPRGARHEMLSLALVQPVSDVQERAGDWDLVLHLIASHHGHARPFGPPVEDPEDLTVSFVHDGTPLAGSTRHYLARVDSPVADRFWRLVRKYGWYGLAWLEAILRLADHRRSEEEAEEVGR